MDMERVADFCMFLLASAVAVLLTTVCVCATIAVAAAFFQRLVV